MACGASALNQLWEREHDAKMRRTEGRPLPSGRLQPETVLIFGGVCSMAGLIYLALAVNLLTSLLGALTLTTYVFVYTPLKRITWLNTAIGAIPGALPPLMGWTAARNELSVEGWALFAILFFWQIPHFLAIAWLYREEYAKAGFVMLPAVDPAGERTRAAGGEPHDGAADGEPAAGGASVVRGRFIFGAPWCAVSFFCGSRFNFREAFRRRSARKCFLLSIIYLPVLLGLMVFDKIKY